MNTPRNIHDVQRAVRVILDQNKISDQLAAVGDPETLSIDDMIRTELPHAVRAVLLVAPGVMIDDAISGVDGSGLALTTLTSKADTVIESGSKQYCLYAGTKVTLTQLSTVTMGQGVVTVTKYIVPAGTVVGSGTDYKPIELDKDLLSVMTELKGYLHTQGGGITATGYGDASTGFYASIQLPSNFLRLLALKLQGWDYMVDHATPRGDATYAIQHSDVYSLRGNPHRPIACITPDGRNIEAFGCNDANPVVTIFDYVAIPEINTSNNTINISDKLYPSVIYYCASLVCTSLGDFKKANAMQAIAMQYITVNTDTNREIQTA